MDRVPLKEIQDHNKTSSNINEPIKDKSGSERAPRPSLLIAFDPLYRSPINQGASVETTEQTEIHFDNSYQKLDTSQKTEDDTLTPTKIIQIIQETASDVQITTIPETVDIINHTPSIAEKNINKENEAAKESENNSIAQIVSEETASNSKLDKEDVEYIDNLNLTTPINTVNIVIPEDKTNIQMDPLIENEQDIEIFYELDEDILDFTQKDDIIRGKEIISEIIENAGTASNVISEQEINIKCNEQLSKSLLSSDNKFNDKNESTSSLTQIQEINENKEAMPIENTGIPSNVISEKEIKMKCNEQLSIQLLSSDNNFNINKEATPIENTETASNVISEKEINMSCDEQLTKALLSSDNKLEVKNESTSSLTQIQEINENKEVMLIENTRTPSNEKPSEKEINSKCDEQLSKPLLSSDTKLNVNNESTSSLTHIQENNENKQATPIENTETASNVISENEINMSCDEQLTKALLSSDNKLEVKNESTSSLTQIQEINENKEVMLIENTETLSNVILEKKNISKCDEQLSKPLLSSDTKFNVTNESTSSLTHIQENNEATHIENTETVNVISEEETASNVICEKEINSKCDEQLPMSFSTSDNEFNIKNETSSSSKHIQNNNENKEAMATNISRHSAPISGNATIFIINPENSNNAFPYSDSISPNQEDFKGTSRKSTTMNCSSTIFDEPHINTVINKTFSPTTKENNLKTSTPLRSSLPICEKVLSETNTLNNIALFLESNTIKDSVFNKDDKNSEGDTVEKLNKSSPTSLLKEMSTMQDELTELKLQVNAGLQQKAQLELMLRQKDEVIIKIQNDNDHLKMQNEEIKIRLEENQIDLCKVKQVKELEEKVSLLENQSKSLQEEVYNKTFYENKLKDVISEYEFMTGTIAKELDKRTQELSVVKRHLANTEFAFSDLHQKYESCKTVIDGFKTNETKLFEKLTESEENNTFLNEKYNALKQHATNQVEKANNVLSTMKHDYETEALKMTGQVKCLEIKLKSMQQLIDQKTRECSELATLLNELTGTG